MTVRPVPDGFEEAAGAVCAVCSGPSGPKPRPGLTDPGWVSALPSMMPLVTATATEGPLSARHVRELSEARRRAGKVRRAAAVAAFNGWTTGIFGACALLGGFWSTPALCLGVALLLASFNELHARRLVLRFQTRGAVRLAWNQIFLAAVVSAYCVWNIREAAHAPSPIASIGATGDAGTDALLADMGNIAHDITVLVYIAVIALTGLLQGLTALYYFSRRKHIAAYRAATPEWIVNLHSQGTLE